MLLQDRLDNSTLRRQNVVVTVEFHSGALVSIEELEVVTSTLPVMVFILLGFVIELQTFNTIAAHHFKDGFEQQS